ncbi:hypothetical protein L917_00412 [Phytophthora nicotianae]|uniref:Lipase-like C-terminal domain-containing protein n=2 Tax=Phytophthora nicotianae TaxID=4792 RepID=W2M322_PHYNI|nr:hypothetical protein L917_00412 [Phytophthora nicotianae]ETO85934.1 hypothetical protein F444_00461 [Phytophthora nicotianae P1976]
MTPRSTTTKFPVVFIHGIFGFGKMRSMWNRWASYWPEKVLNELNENHIVLLVGPLTSNHDRACEAFYQLYGGQVDYGEQHSRDTGHERFGDTYNTSLHSRWNESNPIQLLYQAFPVLKPACDVHWDQWSNVSMMDMLVVNGPVNESKDLGVHDIIPSRSNATLDSSTWTSYTY